MNVLLLLAHSIAEHDDLRMLSRLGYDVFSIGAYTDPAHPADTMRPALPEVPYHPELAALVEGDQMAHKAHLPDGLIDWADVIIAHHYVDSWLAGQWPRIRHKRVIWRTCGQSDPRLEMLMSHLRRDGLEIVRYSPAERRAFERMGCFAGEDALIRFGKEPDEWTGWTGEDAVVGNVTQDMPGRGDHVGLGFWLAATEGLPTRPAGPRSEQLPGSIGSLSYDEMREYLRRCRAYLYTGTVPASYTLGLIEAMMTGVPVVSIGPGAWRGPDALFEGHEIAGASIWYDSPAGAQEELRYLLNNAEAARINGEAARLRAIELFGMDTIAPQWRAYLGDPGVTLLDQADVERRIGAVA